MPYGVASTAHNPGPTQSVSYVYTMNIKTSFGAPLITRATTYSSSNNRYETEVGFTYSGSNSGSAVLGGDSYTSVVYSSSSSYSCKSAWRSSSYSSYTWTIVYTSWEGTDRVTETSNTSWEASGGTEVSRETSAYSFPLESSTTSLSTFATNGTSTRTATETYLGVTASALVSLTRTITETYLGTTVTASRTRYTSTLMGEIAATSVHSIRVTYPNDGEVMYDLGPASPGESTLLTRLADVATTKSSYSTNFNYTTYSTALTDDFVSGIRSFTTTYRLTMATTFESLTGLTVTLTRQISQPTSIAGWYTTATYTRRDSTATTVSRTLTTGFSTSFTGASTSTAYGMTITTQASRSVDTLLGTLLTAPGRYLITSVPATTWSTITAQSTVIGWASPADGNPDRTTGITFAATWTRQATDSSAMWDGAGSQIGTHTSIASFAAENALIPATSLEFSNAGMGLTGIPSGWEPARRMFPISTAFKEYSAVYIPPRISKSVVYYWPATYIGSSSLNSVTLKRLLSTTSDSTSFEWGFVLSSISTANRSIWTHGVVSASTVAVMRHGAYAYTNRDSTGGSTSGTSASQPEAATVTFEGQSIAEGLPFAIARYSSAKFTGYAVTLSDNRLSIIQ